MNKNATIHDLLQELQLTGQVEVLNDTETQELKNIKTENNSRHQTLKKLHERGYSDLIIGIILGIDLIEEKQKNERKWYKPWATK